MNPADLLRLAPRSFASVERQMIAVAFNEAWLVIAPSAGTDPTTIYKMRARLARIIVDLSKAHETPGALASAAIYTAVREALAKTPIAIKLDSPTRKNNAPAGLEPLGHT